MPGCVIILPKTVSPKTVSERLDLSFGIFARRGEKYSCYKFWIIKGRLKIVSDDLFFISFYFATTLSFKVFNTLFTVLILVSTSSI